MPFPASSRRHTDAPHNNRQDWRNLRASLPYLWTYQGRVLAALIFLVLAKIANVGVPLVLKNIVDALDRAPGEVLIYPLLLLAIYGVLKLSSSLFNELRDVVFAKVRYYAMRRMSTEVLQHLHKLSLRFHLERKTGAISRDLDRGARSLSSILNYLIFNIIPTFAEFSLILLILLTHYNAIFTAITLASVAIYVAFTLAIANWRMDYRHDMNRLESEANNQAMDSLINYETVKYFGNETLENRRYNETLTQWEHAAEQTQVSMSTLNFGQGAIIALGVTAMMGFAVSEVLHDKMTLGDLVLVNAFLLQLFMPLNFLGVVYRAITYALADMDLLFKTMQLQPEIQDAPNAPALLAGGGQVRFDQVSFHYQPERPILRDINFTIEPGQKVAVVGPSGAGKSSLARLLFRFYDPCAGRISINGQDIRLATQASVRAAIGIVPQDTVLFNDTLLYNIAYARLDASMDEIREAAQLADILAFIESLPDGFNTRVGERGLKLSGGEKQRVAIARAILKQPAIMIFDEATSSLDTQSEQAIQRALQSVAENRPSLVIAHRLSTIVDADEILVMDQGRIVEHGGHANLLAMNGLYAHLYALQQEETIINTMTRRMPPSAVVLPTP